MKTNKQTNSSFTGVGRIFPRGELGDFSKIFLGGEKVVKFVFSPSKVRKQPLFDEISKIKSVQRSPAPSSRRPWVHL